MTNYEFLASWVARQGGAALDYGCGAGEIVGALRNRGIDARGCDVFYEGSYAQVPQALAPFILRMQGDVIPFPNASFDTVISNQVLEHVPDMRVVSREIRRVLKPGGWCLHLFPDKGVLLEPHARVPFLHWFRKESVLRLPWTMLTRALRYGSRAWPLRQSSARRIDFVDSWTHYRTRDEVRSTFAADFANVEFIESEIVDARVRAPLPRFLKVALYRIGAGSALRMRAR